MRPRVSSILGFPEEKLKRAVEKENEEDSVGSSSEEGAAIAIATLEVELHIALQHRHQHKNTLTLKLNYFNLIFSISSSNPQIFIINFLTFLF